VGLVAPSDIPYCGEAETTEDESTRPLYEVCSPYSVQSSMAKVVNNFVTTNPSTSLLFSFYIN